MKFYAKMRLCPGVNMRWQDLNLRRQQVSVPMRLLHCKHLNYEYESSVWDYLFSSKMSPNYRPTIHKTMFIYLIDGSLKIFFKDNFDYLGFSLNVLPLEPNFLQEVRWDFTLCGREGERKQMWKSFLNAKDNIEKGKKETTNLDFWSLP